jgi:hypothetical protein
MDTIQGVKRLKGESLVNLLNAIPGRSCKLPRDRVYSILSLISEGPSITVDYSSSDLAFYSQILQVCKKSVCFCSAGLIAYDMDWDFFENSPLEEEATKLVMYTNVTPQTFRRKKDDANSYDQLCRKCPACNSPTYPARWPGEVHTFCLQQICSSFKWPDRYLDGHEYTYHLYLSTTTPTQHKLFLVKTTKSGCVKVIELGNDVSIEDVADSNLFQIGFDILGDFCKDLFRSPERGEGELGICERARFGNGQFTVRQVKHDKDEPI